MAGFHQFTYEYGVKDTVLDSWSLSFCWYSLLKERTSHLLPRAECHTKLIKALRVINPRREVWRETPAPKIQARWVEMEKAEITSDFRQGCVLKAGAEAAGPFTMDDQANIETEVPRELGHMTLEQISYSVDCYGYYRTLGTCLFEKLQKWPVRRRGTSYKNGPSIQYVHVCTVQYSTLRMYG
ncbi:hypothetical protein B0T26DRAFT_65491 [Lasiosphaeria miniovina]|uniref:Uncharacterized protein n=1 Tax=Lasiosphaeria miniovina TaxID=1954250 RepID=A0AA40EAE9_9PEZI|nr:uncharacterized protein B0T26DRAFT_65491 [Lasiosphaeria miniovina]KAK0734329.1 hypothetical protein B0T26DRAFT_65491 [Lasiosphaeria miniovina]